MRVLYNECLKKYTTVKIGGYAKNLYFPESINELLDLTNSISESKYYILGGGSNILMNDQKTYENVICMNKVDRSITKLGSGKYYIGASVRLQKLINTINEEGFGGIEYLYSVPALVGGAVVMNAGRGKHYAKAISDYIKDVHVIDKGSIKVLSKEECNFGYRNSILKNSELIVIGVTFIFEPITIEETSKIKNERITLCKNTQDNSGYNFGSVFREKNGKIMLMVKLISPGYKKGMAFSNKTTNWLINKGEGTYLQAITLIKRVQKLHKILGKKAVPEVIIWD